jgi:hypothetical protein
MGEPCALSEQSDYLRSISLVLPAGASLEEVLSASPKVPFDNSVVEFIVGLGKSLRTDPATRAFPELVALGFWARAATLRQLKIRFETAYPRTIRLARGLAFHVAPANVDSIFVYSLLLSMLAGNTNLTRISSRSGAQSNALLSVLHRALAEGPSEVRASVAIVQFPHENRITDYLSRRADLRIIWGGDATVDQIRRSPLAPSGTELVFPNRYSLAVFDAGAWTREENKAAIARGFVNDALWFGQMACSSPRSVVWRGDKDAVEAASDSFWDLVDQAATQAKVGWEDASAVAKLLAEQDMAVVRRIHILHTKTNRLRVVRLADLTTLGEPPATGGGFFCEYRVDSLDALAVACRRNWQTVVSYGVTRDDWENFLTEHRPPGIDRIVPVGSALDFDAIWDGVDLLATMTRIASIAVRS